MSEVTQFYRKDIGFCVRLSDYNALQQQLAEQAQEITRLKAALESICRRFTAAEKGGLYIRPGVAWAMDSDARAALNPPQPATDDPEEDLILICEYSDRTRSATVLCSEPAVVEVGGKWYCGEHAKVVESEGK